jgi:hypothetical protein
MIHIRPAFTIWTIFGNYGVASRLMGCALLHPSYKSFVIPAKAGIQALTGIDRRPAGGEFGQPKTHGFPLAACRT